MTASIEIQRFRSTTSTQNSIWQTFSQKDHSQGTDGHNWHYWSTSWRTPHSLKATCQSLLRLWILYFPSMSKRAGESFAASASAKQKPVHCTAMFARRIADKNADWTIAVLPPDHKAGGDSEREDMCQQDLQTLTMTARALSWSTLVVATVSRDPLNIGEGKVHLQANADG